MADAQFAGWWFERERNGHCTHLDERDMHGRQRRMRIVERINSPAVGVVCDVYHIFWDAHVEHEIARAGTSICGLHLSDWLTPRGDTTADRAMIGDGSIDIASLASAVESARYRGDIEIEILNEPAWRDADLDT